MRGKTAKTRQTKLTEDEKSRAELMTYRRKEHCRKIDETLGIILASIGEYDGGYEKQVA